MAIKLQCSCGKALSIKDEFAGRKVKCPACQKPLNIPASNEFTEGEFADEPDEFPRKSRLREKSRARGKAMKKGKKSSSSNRGLLIGLGTGGGVLVVVILAWMLWPSKPDVVVDAPAGNGVGTPAIVSVGSASPNSTNTETAPTTTPAPADDLQWVQGTWQVNDVAMHPEAQETEQVIAHMKQSRWSILGDILTMSTPQVATAWTIKLAPSQTPKTIDMTRLESGDLRKTTLGIYAITGETWQLCMDLKEGPVRPAEMKTDKALTQIILTFQRGAPTAVVAATQFDMKAWQTAEPKLKAMKVFAMMDSVAGQAGVADGMTHVVIISPPETVDGTLSSELWAIVSSLSHVIIRPTFTTDATLQQVSQHPGIVGLNLSGRSSVSPKGIAILEICPQLQSLYFSEVPVSSELLEAVGHLSRLRGFGIYKSPVSSEMLGSIIQLSQLESLSLQETGITDEDAVQIARLTKLKTLLLNGSKVTDAGLQTLKSLKDLTHFDVRGLAVTSQSVVDFEASLPNCKVLK